MNLFISEIEKIKPAKELDFEPTLGFGKYGRFFSPEAKQHPAKMNMHLLEYLIENYTNEGETILDPMAGTCSTTILASLHNRKSIAVELEEKFVKWSIETKKKLEELPTLNPKGEIKIIQGDARKLSELLRNIDAIITSPPYEDTMGEKRHATPNTGTCERLVQEKHLGWYLTTPNNIGSMKKETYLSAMLEVYKQMYSVLKPGGRAIVVIKPFIRDKKVIDLPYHTHLLLSHAGFVLEDVLKLKLKIKSFWRVLYERKHPEVPSIQHEYVLVVRKGVIHAM